MSVSRARVILRNHAAIAIVAACTGAVFGQSPSNSRENIPNIVRQVNPSVVMVVVHDRTGRELGTGSGFLVSADGKVVTNYHVVSMPGAAQAELRFADGGSYQADGVLAMDPDKDLAVLRIRATGRNFQFLPLADSDRVQVGERILAIGSPLAGLSTVNTANTVSDGIVSGKRDWSNGKMTVLQITAPVSPGSSGGVLLNMDGEVVGVTFAQLVGGQNLNFAVPIDYIRSLLNDGPIRSLAAINAILPDERGETERAPTGSYTGKWQSSKFSVSGAATMTITVAGGETTAEIFLTGGEVTSALLSGTARRTGTNIWTVELVSKRPKLSVRGIFRDNSFVGDYTYTRFLMFDQGQWVLTKE